MSLEQTFGALADPTRRSVVELLRAKPRRASDLADELGASRPLMSKHLKILRSSGLVETSQEDDARFRLYSLRREQFDEMRSWLEEVEQFWNVQLKAFAEHVTKKVARDQRR
ncbi:MAG TPA: metalloregulator ArsR/SmtB family transcription factor [Kofleriaceae bacterium]